MVTTTKKRRTAGGTSIAVFGILLLLAGCGQTFSDTGPAGGLTGGDGLGSGAPLSGAGVTDANTGAGSGLDSGAALSGSGLDSGAAGGSTSVAGNNPAAASARVADLIAGMSLEEKVGQLFVVQLRFTRDGQPYTALDQEGREFLESVGPSGVILFTENFRSVEQVVKLVWELQHSRPAGAPPLLIAVDQEGGLVDRLTRNPGMTAIRIPAAATMAKRGLQAVWTAGYITGRELRALGVGVNLAPITDIGDPVGGGFLGSRAFSSNPREVAAFVDAFVRGQNVSGVLSIMKHYPGHGPGESDSHFESVVRRIEKKDLLENDLLPVIAGFQAGAAGVMVAHVSFPDIDPSGLPASVSPRLIDGLLRDELGFQGLVMTDALEMKGILAHMSPEAAAVQAVLAGVDLILSPAGALAKKNAILAAVRSGELPEGLVTRSLERILLARMSLDPVFGGLGLEDALKEAVSTVGSRAHSNLLESALSATQ